MKTIEGKVVLLGSQGVGKTSLIVRYVEKAFNDNTKSTIAASFFSCRINLEDARIKLQVWDTAGEEKFRSMAPMYYRKANAAFLVFDITNRTTFEAIKTWVNELKRNVEEVMVLILIGNKIDLEHKRDVDSEECQKYATLIGASYYETSALNDDGVEKVILAASRGLLNLSCGDNNLTSLRIYDSNSSGFSTPEIMLTPTSEEVLTNGSIAHGIHEKPFACC